MSATDRLERLLYVLPRAARADGARIDELARALDVAPAVILADIEEATARVFYHPAGMVDAFNLSVEGDVVRLYNADFSRPVRLTMPEAMALGLGLRVLAAEAEPERRAEILALAMRLEQELVTPGLQLQPALTVRGLREPKPFTPPAQLREVEVAFGEDDFRGDIAEAIAARVLCDVLYLKADGSAPTERTIAPVRLLYTRGHWYLRAFEADFAELRVYRLDRMLELSVTTARHRFEEPVPHETAFGTDGGRRVSVRYSWQVARWVAEREDAQCERDGTLVLTYDVVDMNWLVRHVLQYGGEAVVETPDVKQHIVEAARSMT